MHSESKSRFHHSTIGRVVVLLLVLSLVGCSFEPSVTPIVWPTPPQAFQPGTVLGTPAPSPVPIAPTPSPPPPTPVPFQGSDDLDCEGPIGGDEHFGYCSVPDSDQYYVWGECSEPCPGSEYPGIELKVVDDSSDYRDFVEIISQRDVQLDKKRSSGGWALGLGGADVVGATLGWEAAECVVGAEVTLGTSCIAFAITLGSGVVAAIKLGADYIGANNALNGEDGLNAQAEAKFADLVPMP